MSKLYRCRVIGLAISVSLLFGCKKDKSDPVVANNTVDIYMAGYNESNGRETPVYWKNETLVDTLPTPAGFIYSQAKCIAAVGNEVYVGGIAIDSHGFSTALYWKNGQPVLLDSGLINSAVSGIAVAGNDVYFSGFKSKPYETIYTPVYWKNDQLLYLPVTDTTASITNGISVVGQDVYVTSGGANYWKNGSLVEPNINGSIAALGISGSDTYYAGVSGTYPLLVATYWKNGQPTILDEPAGAETRNSDAFAMSVSGSDVYILGTGFVGSTNSFTNRYWVNGKRMEFDNKGLPLYASGIATAGKDVYMAGGRALGINVSGYNGCYWKNGEPIDFPIDPLLQHPYCIFVVAH